MTVDLVINERRKETRRTPSAHHAAAVPQVLGARVIEVVDTSAHGLRCRLARPVRPGRPMPLRLAVGSETLVFAAFVVRCHVYRLTRHGVQYEAAWSIDGHWRHE